MKRIITGIRPTSNLTVANLIGAAVPLLELQNLEDEVSVFVATMHGLTDHEPMEVVPNVKEVVRDYVALGLDPEKVTVFDQRDVRRQVALLKLYLERHITVARACRVPTLKDKLKEGQTPEQANVLLMGYPILMTADILLQDIDVVPVGKDQYSHMEVVRELAEIFNKKYGKTFIVPATMNREEPVNILALSGEGKMSKSKPETALFLTDDSKTIKKKLGRAETALEGEMTPNLESLVKMGKMLAPERKKEIKEFIAKHMAGEKVMGGFKALLTEIVIDFTKTFQKKREDITDKQVEEILKQGAEVAGKNADIVIERVETALGIK